MNKKDRDKVKLREVVHRQLRFEMWPLTFLGWRDFRLIIDDHSYRALVTQTTS